MAEWTPEQLHLLHDIEEVLITPIDELEPPAVGRLIWVLELDGRVFARSWKGPNKEWYRRAIATGRARLSAPGTRADGIEVEVELRPDHDPQTAEAIVAEYARKYSPPYAQEMDAPIARDTTVELIPANPAP